MHIFPGNLVRDKRNQGVALWRNIILAPETGRYRMEDRITDGFSGLAIVLAVPEFHGATSQPDVGAVLLCTHQGRVAWTWGHMLKVMP